MLVYEIIKNKRDGGALSQAAIDQMISGYTNGTLPDYQMAALLMAIFYQGMETEELAAWTRAMVHSGEVIEFAGEGPYIDKHSTGGVGDKVSLPLAPILACMGMRVPMISGRGLGHTGGTLDKLESIPGYQTGISVDRFKEIVDTVGCCIIGQTASLAPADKKLYALRDVTATVDSIPLIASSILSKKRASGIAGLLMDVKTGSGAFMQRFEDASALARTLVELGGALGMKVRACITDMNQVLGRKAGNALEILESIEVLRGEGPEDVTELVVRFAATMSLMAGICDSEGAGRQMVSSVISSGEALQKFAQMIEAQGGNPRVCDDTGLLPLDALRAPFLAPRTGHIVKVDCEKVGQSIVALGGGRRRIEDAVDPAVGLDVTTRIGDSVVAGQPLATVFYRTQAGLDEALGILRRAYQIGDEPAPALPLVLDTI
jgi:pyrimidine-nucleoside phosphorylase